MIWCVEDDPSIRDIEVYALVSTGLEARGFEDGSTFWDALQKKQPDLVLLDVMLPGVDGLELLTRLKASERFRDLPVIMATAKGSESDKVYALDMGADDYIAKPFGMMEMVSRVKAVLRRVYPKQGDGLLQVGDLVVNLKEHRVCLAGETIQLTAKEFDLLKLLLSHPGEVFNREQLRQMLAMLEQCPEPKTLTNVGKLMGCSRQNIKKLAAVLAQKGYLTMTEGANNAVCLEETEKVAAYSAQMAERRSQVMQLLFADFSEEEISHFYSLNRKLYTGIQRVEDYAKTVDNGGSL